MAPQYVNQIATQVGPAAGPNGVPDGIYITVGVATLPIIVGSPEEVSLELSALNPLRVEVVGRYVVSRERAAEFRDLLDTAIKQYDTTAEAGHKEVDIDGSADLPRA